MANSPQWRGQLVAPQGTLDESCASDGTDAPIWVVLDLEKPMAASVPRLSGVLETSLYVTDLDRACDFYERVFGFERFVHDGRMCGLGVPGGQVLLLFHHGSTNEP